MMKKTNSKNFHNRAVRFQKFVDGLAEGGDEAYKAFDAMLDLLRAAEFFGDEAQHDPRNPTA